MRRHLPVPGYLLAILLSACTKCSSPKHSVAPHADAPKGGPTSPKDSNMRRLDYALLQASEEVGHLTGFQENLRAPSPQTREAILALASSVERAVQSGDSKTYLDMFDLDSSEYRRQKDEVLKYLFNPSRPLKQNIRLQDVFEVDPAQAVGIADIHTRAQAPGPTPSSKDTVEKNWVTDFRNVGGKWKVSDPPYNIFAGQVLDAEKAAPLRDAAVFVGGASTRTSNFGLFSFSRLPPGVRSVEVLPADGRPARLFDVAIRNGRHQTILTYGR